MQARNEIVSDYEKRKKSLLESMSQVYNSAAFKGGVTVSMDSWIESHEKFEDQKRILRTIVTNENDKIAVHEKQLEAYAQYIIGFSDDTAKMKRLLPQYVDAVFLEPDEEFENLKIVRLDYLKKQRRQSQLKMDLEETTLAIDDAKNLIMKLTKLGTNDADGTDALMKNTKEKHQTIKAEYEHALREYEEAEETYERMKSEYSRNRKKNNLDFRSLIKGAGSPGNTQFGLLFKDKGGKSKDAQSAVTSGKDDSGTTDPDDQGADTQKKAGSADAGQKNRANYQDIDIPWTW